MGQVKPGACENSEALVFLFLYLASFERRESALGEIFSPRYLPVIRPPLPIRPGNIGMGRTLSR